MKRRLALALLVFLVASACSLISPSEAPPPRDRAGAPPVLAPRDLQVRVSDPCSTLSAAQLAELGYVERGAVSVTAAGSPNCTWRPPRSARGVAVKVSIGDDLFVESYRNRIYPEFRELGIAGLPAVQLSAGSQAFTCTTTVGVAELDAVDINTSVESSRGRPVNDPCEDGRRVAEAVVSTLPPQS